MGKKNQKSIAQEIVGDKVPPSTVITEPIPFVPAEEPPPISDEEIEAELDRAFDEETAAAERDFDQELEAPPERVVAGKLFGLVKDPIRKLNYECYFLITATVDEDGEIIAVEKSEQSWLPFEAKHKMERAAEESLIATMKNPSEAKK